MFKIQLNVEFQLCCYNKKLEERESEKIAETENSNVPEVSKENVEGKAFFTSVLKNTENSKAQTRNEKN